MVLALGRWFPFLLWQVGTRVRHLLIHCLAMSGTGSFRPGVKSALDLHSEGYQHRHQHQHSIPRLHSEQAKLATYLALPNHDRETGGSL